MELKVGDLIFGEYTNMHNNNEKLKGYLVFTKCEKNGGTAIWNTELRVVYVIDTKGMWIKNGKFFGLFCKENKNKLSA